MPAYAGMLIAVFLYAIGGGLIEVLISPIVDSIARGRQGIDNEPASLVYSWGQVWWLHCPPCCCS